jgi:DNA-binding transcriptional ArsR family regulator
MLPIRQTLNALPGLKRTEKAVLIEVCQLAENSEPAGWCTAKNDYLVQALGGTERTMSRTLTALEGRGLLVSKGQGKARKLSPSPTLRACYAGADDAARRAAVATLNLDKMGRA